MAKITTIIALVLLMMLTACGTTREVPFEVANNYFVRNDAPRPIPMKITTRDTFERIFGMAAVMGKDGLPTSIDFERQFVIAVVLPETNHFTTVEVKRLTNEAEGLMVTAQVEASKEENTWTMIPMQLLIVDRAYERDSVFNKNKSMQTKERP